MADVVVLGWDSTTRELQYVAVNGGDGSGRLRHVVSERDAAEVGSVCDAEELPRAGELEIAEEDCVLDLTGPRVVECSVSPRGARTVRLTDPLRNGQRVADLAPEKMGVADPEVASRANRIGRFLYFEGGARSDGVVGCWVVEGGLGEWLRRDREAKEQREAHRLEAKEQRERQDRHDRSFINPYTFVPFPAAIDRRQPGGHLLLTPDRLSGSMQVRWELTSPLQAPEGTVKGEPLRLAGASVKGAVRSLHETLAGGCLRVLDEDFVPSYRDTASVPPREWTLAEVATVTHDGQPLTVRLCDPVVWVGSGQLRAACGSGLATGSRVTLDLERATEKLGRLELPADAEVEAGGDWVVLLTDGGARRAEVTDRKTGDKRDGAYFAACGHLPAGAEETPVAERAWKDFRRAVAGARDVQERAAATRAGQQFEDRPLAGLRGKPPVGRRNAVTGRLATGDIVWVRRAGGEVDRLRLSVIWRHAGKGPMGKRVPKHLRPCWDPARLCPSCRLFGSADTRPRQPDEEARQRSYAGHVRFGEALTATAVRLETIRRAPLGTPRPGAGQFYLRLDDLAPASHEAERPTREWGARPDETELRQMRGRKFYWHADPTVQPVPRHTAREHQRNPRLSTEQHLVPAGTMLTQTVTFDNLSKDELGSLIAVLEPHRVLPPDSPGSRPLRLHLGGGKPLGLGSCTASMAQLRVWTAQSRYGEAEAVLADPDDYVRRFVESTPPAVVERWPAVTAVLAADSVDPRRVWYPPGAHWPDQRSTPKDFDEPFAFFTGTSGMFLAERGPRQLVPLPDPTDENQDLRIIRKADLDKGLGASGG
jgi:hypothetical protein